MTICLHFLFIISKDTVICLWFFLFGCFFLKTVHPQIGQLLEQSEKGFHVQSVFYIEGILPWLGFFNNFFDDNLKF